METQLAQIAQQVTHLSRPQRHLLGQLEANPKGHMNTSFLVVENNLMNPKSLKERMVSVWSRKRANH